MCSLLLNACSKHVQASLSPPPLSSLPPLSPSSSPTLPPLLLPLPQIGLSFDDVRMAVLVQRVVPAHYAFVIHTRNPSNNDPDEIFCELVRGLGECLRPALDGRGRETVPVCASVRTMTPFPPSVLTNGGDHTACATFPFLMLFSFS